MVKADCYELGIVSNTHGIKGGLHCRLDVDDPARYAGLESVYIESGTAFRLHKVKHISLRGNLAYVYLEGIETMTDAESLKGGVLYLPLSQLPPPGANRFYIHEVFGYEVVDANHGSIGVLQGIIETPGQRLAQVRSGQREILLPLIGEFIERIDREKKTVHVNLPDGMMELYS